MISDAIAHSFVIIIIIIIGGGGGQMCLNEQTLDFNMSWLMNDASHPIDLNVNIFSGKPSVATLFDVITLYKDTKLFELISA